MSMVIGSLSHKGGGTENTTRVWKEMMEYFKLGRNMKEMFYQSVTQATGKKISVFFKQESNL